MRLADVVDKAVADQPHAPAAALALLYAERIDECGHVGLALAAALAELQRAAEKADDMSTMEAKGKPDRTARTAYLKVAAALSAVTVAAELGPKLLAALDALLLTPKARAGIGEALTPTKPTVSPLDAIRAAEDDLAKQRAKRTG